MTKYHSRKVVRDGITYDSVKEYQSYCELLLLEKAGAITGLKRQVRFKLIPAHYETVVDSKTGKQKRTCVDRECSYVADFVYQNKDGEIVVEDTKGYKTPDYKIKRKLMWYLKGIRIKET